MIDALRLSEAEEYLQKKDSTLGQLIEMQKPIYREPRTDYFFSLCRSIVGQQISVKAAAKIFARLEEYTSLRPDKVAAIDNKLAKRIGLSKQKTDYLKDLAKHFVDNPNVYNHLEKSTDDEVIKELTDIKGIGVWTAQMFLMFTLLRMDVFPVDDIGIQRAIMNLYGFKKKPKLDRLDKIAKKWSPYRTVACWHLWESLNNNPIAKRG